MYLPPPPHCRSCRSPSATRTRTATLPYNTCLRIHTRYRAASAANAGAASAAVVTVGVAIIAFVRFLLYSSVRLQFVFVILKFSRFLCCVPLCSCVWHLFRVRVCTCVHMCVCVCVCSRSFIMPFSLIKCTLNSAS